MKKYKDPLEILKTVHDAWGHGYNVKGFKYPTLAIYHEIQHVIYQLDFYGESVFYMEDIKDALEECGFVVKKYRTINYKVVR